MFIAVKISSASPFSLLQEDKSNSLLSPDSTLFQQRVKNRSIPDKPPVVEKTEVPVVASHTSNHSYTNSEVPVVASHTSNHSYTNSEVPVVASHTSNHSYTNSEVPVVASHTNSEVQTVSDPEDDVPLVRSQTISNVQSTPIAPGN